MNWVANIAGRLPVSLIKRISRLRWNHPVLKKAVAWFEHGVQNRDGIIPRGVGRGLRFNPGGANAGYALGTSEPDVQHAFSTLVRPGMVVYDVGANVGFYTVLAGRLVGPTGIVISVEPLPWNCQAIEHNVRMNAFANVTLIRLALGDLDGEAAFQVNAAVTLGRLASIGGVLPGNCEIVQVRVARLDSLVRRHGLPAPGFIKLDVEGAETLALAGGVETLLQARPLLLIELHGTNEPVAKRLAEVGYRPVVLGSALSVLASPWNAHVVAVPRERADLAATLSSLTMSDHGMASYGLPSANSDSGM